MNGSKQEIIAGQSLTVTDDWARLFNDRTVVIIQGQQLNIDALTKVVQNVISERIPEEHDLYRLIDRLIETSLDKQLSLKYLTLLIQERFISCLLERSGGNVKKASETNPTPRSTIQNLKQRFEND